MGYLKVVGDNERRGARHGERLTVAVVDSPAQRGGDDIFSDLLYREFGVVRVVDNLYVEKSNTECAEAQREHGTK